MSDIKETIYNLAKSATKTSGDLFKSTKLSMAVTSEQAMIKKLHIEIGQKVHEIYQYGGNLGKFFDEKYREIEASEIKIAELKEQISLIKGTKECDKCGKTVERNAEFCPKCGIRVAALGSSAAETVPQTTPMPPETEATPPMPPVAQHPIQNPTPAPLPQTRNCRVCGAANEPDTKFCLSCGRIVD